MTASAAQQSQKKTKKSTSSSKPKAADSSKQSQSLFRQVLRLWPLWLTLFAAGFGIGYYLIQYLLEG